jgi:hypothetical protein
MERTHTSIQGCNKNSTTLGVIMLRNHNLARSLLNRTVLYFLHRLWRQKHDTKHKAGMLTTKYVKGSTWKANSSWAGQDPRSFYTAQRFITVFTRARRCTLSWTWRTRSTPSHPVFFQDPTSPNYLSLSCIPTTILYAFLISPMLTTDRNASLRTCKIQRHCMQLETMHSEI